MATSNYAVAPGEYLQEWIEDHGLTTTEVADRFGVERKLLDEVITGRAILTEGIATTLERIVGIPAKTWLRYEASYRVDLVRQPFE